MKFDKLVRDHIPAIIEKKGKKAIFHLAENNEYWQKLTDKLQEEVDEFMSDLNLEELADITEVIQAICEYKGYSLSSLEKARKDKHRDKGGFSKRVVLEEIQD